MPLPVRAEALEAWTGQPELTWRQVPQAGTSDAPAPELAAQAVHGKSEPHQLHAAGLRTAYTPREVPEEAL